MLHGEFKALQDAEEQFYRQKARGLLGVADSKVVGWSYQEFYLSSGLQLNTSKSELFAAGVLEDELDSMISDHWVQGSRLLVRYLGLPPVARKLSIPDCKALIEKIVAKINHWSCNYVIISVERLVRGSKS
ncbi:Geminivirus AR1/BR1 coat protein [Gossypium australe]|uniref:Geminivirus AR1/BR1 coat protein n=1 Tax=Gossypium australe TaxID=47621 RepID=A0A5B6X6R2_9ROSI|nr:Geminivirus AR1/BR1 coat protein [Gossypium australe]